MSAELALIGPILAAMLAAATPLLFEIGRAHV